MNHLEFRLKEASAILDTLRDQCTLTHADLWAAEVEYAKAVDDAKHRDTMELSDWMLQEHSNRLALDDWRYQQSREAITSLRCKKTWQHRLLIFIACFFSCGVFLILETREIRTLQQNRDEPRLGEKQRTWVRDMEHAQRKITFLRSLQNPRPTQEMREWQHEVFSLRKKRDMLEHQIQLQETRVKVLQQELASSSI